MRKICEKCETFLEENGTAFICSYECTFCAECTDKMNMLCPNCGGELRRRPKRESKS